MAPQSESGRNSVPGGSPLDILPIQPSIFPMPPRSNNNVIRNQLVEAEGQVVIRSRAVEAKWSCDEWQQSSAGTILQKVLSALDALDRHVFDKIDGTNSLDTLYSQIFPTPPVKDNPVEGDAPIIILLLRWAVSSQRTGDHRALVVARLLEHRQSDVLNSSNSNSNDNTTTEGQNANQQNGETSSWSNINIKSESPCDGDAPMLEREVEDSSNSNNNNNSNSSSNNTKLVNGLCNNSSGNENEEFPNGLPVYHNLLLRFLDSDSPVLGKLNRSNRYLRDRF